MNAKRNPGRVGVCVAAAAMAFAGLPPASAADKLAVVSQPIADATMVVMDKASASTLELQLLVHRPDLPLRPLPLRSHPASQKDKS